MAPLIDGILPPQPEPCQKNALWHSRPSCGTLALKTTGGRPMANEADTCRLYVTPNALLPSILDKAFKGEL